MPHEMVRTANDPDAALMRFLSSTYEAAVELGGWDRAALECEFGQPRVPRLVEPPPEAASMEACGGAHHWARELERAGHEVRLIAPR